jgi:starch-binding outer membrane protein, SusD/RagB family
MKKLSIKNIAILGFAIFSIASCKKQLNLYPTNDVTQAQVYKDLASYKQALAKVYSSIATTGNNGPGSGDIAGIDAGTSDFFRLYWKAQELSTDEAVVAWGDPGIQDFHNMNWTADNPMTQGLYYRCFQQIAYANDFIRQSTDAKLSERNISGADAAEIKKFSAEARFLRAFQYWVLMDLFAKPPFITETYEFGSATLPTQTTRAALFSWIEGELKDLETKLPAAKSNEYGRFDLAAAQALLARMYLNASVYTGTAKNTEAATYAKKVIDHNYTLMSDYTQLFLADNNINNREFIATINYDGLKTRTYGGTTFLTHASVGGSMNAADYGINGGWFGLRTTKALPNLFADITGATDKRAQFFTGGQNLEITSLSTFTDGYAIRKFRNKSKTGVNGQDLEFVDIDMPLFRLPEMYLIYTEAVLRGSTFGDQATALGYINALRGRAYGDASGNLASTSALSLNFVLDERARELYWEGHRRTDLVRYGRFTDASYLWPWKGGVAAGQGVSATRNLYYIPNSEINVYGGALSQNP